MARTKPPIKKPVNITDQRFGRLQAVKLAFRDKHNREFWLFKCDCGQEKAIEKSSVKTGHTKSCGCWQLENNKVVGITHNKSKTREYKIWLGIKKRCLDSNHSTYKNYGKRGIKICDRWLDSFENFLEDMGNCPSDIHSIDRVNNDGNYESLNCRWATRKEQNNNCRRNRLFDHDGLQYTLSQLCEKLNVKYHLIYDRIYVLNWTLEEAICQ